VPEIRYAAYRAYTAKRTEVNNAMMALLSGSRLAAHTLQLTEGSTATLGQLFPAVEHIDRFNLPSDQARAFLRSADEHIASVAIPYALATHEAFVTDTLSLIANEGTTLITHGKRVRAWNMHTVFFESCQRPEPNNLMDVFHLMRTMRNCIIHGQGRVDADLRTAISSMGAPGRAEWQRLNAGKQPEDVDGGGGNLALTAEHIFAAFAITKRLGREVNAVLGSHLGPDVWARLAVVDFAASTQRTRNSDQWRRSLLGYVREYYGGTSVLENDLERAARSLGHWTRPKWG
jgi:hypothetical protein